MMQTAQQPTPQPEPPQKSVHEIFQAASKRALGGGIAGAGAMAIQVTSLMWMRTTMNYQYKTGATTMEAFRHLYKEGGIRRFYRGYAPGLLQGPLSRFGDTAANVGVLEFMNNNASTKDLPVFAKTGVSSLAAASWRICIMPIDATKTTLQVHGAPGLKILGSKIRAGGPTVLWHGSLAAYTATLVGHFPWFFTYNMLDEKLPAWDQTIWTKLGRRAMMGFVASVISDTLSNSIRVVKTYRQTAAEAITYPNAVRAIIREGGMVSLFGRGLKTRIIANGTQGLMFSVLWKGFQDMLEKRDQDEE
eukprot:55594_1